MKDSKNKKRVLKMFAALVAASFTITAFQNCGSSDGDSGNSSLDFIEAGESAVPPIKVEKTDRILHSRTVANALIQGIGVNNAAKTDLTSTAIGLQMLFSETGDYDSITGGQITIHATNLAETACEQMIFNSERDKATMVDGKWVDERRFFKGLYIGDNAAEASPAYPVFSDARYRSAIKRMARTTWGRDSSKIEEDEILGAIGPIIGDTKANRGYRAAVVTCTIMTSTFDFMRQ